MNSLGLDIGGSSVKFATRAGDNFTCTGRSAAYHRPDRAALIRAIQDSLPDQSENFHDVGLCLPGVLNASRDALELSVHLPQLVGVSIRDLVAEALGEPPRQLIVTSDAVATAYDLFAARRLTGRLLLLAIGTGVGAAVMDDGVPLRVNGDSPGHFGQLDVSLNDSPPIGPDGGAGGLEAYLSAAALQREYGPDVPTAVARLSSEDPAIRALARAIRIGHAIYRPHHVALAGGIGIHLGHVLPDLRKKIETNLTKLARPGWTLSTGDSDFHAAQGAARMAAVSSSFRQ